MRKTVAVLIKVFLATQSVIVQAMAMGGVCVIALVLQVRVRPYDDDNIKNMFNPADAVISNNKLEQILLTLQICQLAVGVSSEIVRVSDDVLAVAYLVIFALGAVFSLVALSSRFAKAADAFIKSLAPLLDCAKACLGIKPPAALRSEDPDDLASAGVKTLLAAGQAFEAAKVKTFEEEQAVILEKLAAATGASDNRSKANAAHRAALLYEKQGMQRAKDAWNARRAEFGDGGMHTIADIMGREADQNESQKAAVAANKEYWATKAADKRDARLKKEKQVYEARRRKSATNGTGGRFATNPEAFHGTVNQSTFSLEMRAAAFKEERRAKERDAHSNDRQAAQYQARLLEQDGYRTRQVEWDGHAGEMTKAMLARQAETAQRTEDRRRAEAEAAQLQDSWAARQARTGGATKPVDMGRLGETTAASKRRQSARAEALEAAAAAAAKEEAERVAQQGAWERRRAKQQANPIVRGSLRQSPSSAAGGASTRNTSHSSKGGGMTDSDAAKVAAMYVEPRNSSSSSGEAGQVEQL